jgi:hypothetical protein
LKYEIPDQVRNDNFPVALSVFCALFLGTHYAKWVSFLILLSKWISKAKKEETLKQVLAFGDERSAE